MTQSISDMIDSAARRSSDHGMVQSHHSMVWSNQIMAWFGPIKSWHALVHSNHSVGWRAGQPLGPRDRTMPCSTRVVQGRERCASGLRPRRSGGCGGVSRKGGAPSGQGFRVSTGTRVGRAGPVRRAAQIASHQKSRAGWRAAVGSGAARCGSRALAQWYRFRRPGLERGFSVETEPLRGGVAMRRPVAIRHALAAAGAEEAPRSV
jgi:hypothetical protein